MTATLEILKNFPLSASDRNAFANGLSRIMPDGDGGFRDYDVVMGDLGLAFIMQASDKVAVIDGALDVGWWPLAWDCLPILLKPYAETAGIEINWLGISYERYKEDSEKYFRAFLQQTLQQYMKGGKLALVNDGLWHIAVKYDSTSHPPLYGYCPNAEKPEAGILPKYPIFAVTFGGKTQPRSREKANIAGLQQAVALGRDQLPMPNGYVTGQKAFALWIMTLRDIVHRGEARYHANVVYNLKINRISAIKYLAMVAKVSPEKAAFRLNNAIRAYGDVLQELAQADTSKEALIFSADGREKLARQVARMAALEAMAINEIEQGLAALQADKP